MSARETKLLAATKHRASRSLYQAIAPLLEELWHAPSFG